ncbi:MAG: MFS transporter [Verrucomicrobia bacterium]|nr:MFS transporter [Verrucomicrobiota bacterium]
MCSFDIRIPIIAHQHRISTKHGIWALNIAQFLTALNDNLFKFLTIYLLIDINKGANTSKILFWVGICYVLPFILFSTYAGVLADRLSKQKLIIALKFFGFLVIGLAFFVYFYRWEWGCYAMVFLLSMQSALLGPSKYSIIPELVRHDQISKTNGLITSWCYLAMIIGSFLASYIMDATGKNFLIALIFAFVAGAVGLIASFYIPVTQAHKATKKMAPWIFQEVRDTLQLCHRTPRLVIAVFGSAFFLFIAAFVQLNMVPYAMYTLNLSEVRAGYLFFGVAVGIALGAYAAGKICKKEVDLGLSCFAVLAMGLLFLVLPFLAGKVYAALGVLVTLGFFGGLFVVPLDSYVQAFSPTQTRGRVVASANFLSFLGVFLAPLCLLLFSSALKASAALGFGFLGFLLIGSFFFFLKYLSAPSLAFFVRHIMHPLFDLHYRGYPFGTQNSEERAVLISQDGEWKNVALLLGESPKIQLFVVKTKKEFFDPLVRLFSTIHIIYVNENSILDPSEIHRKVNAGSFFFKPVYFFANSASYEIFAKQNYFERLARDLRYNLRFFRVHTTKVFPASSFFKREQKTFSFQTHAMGAPIKKSLSTAR